MPAAALEDLLQGKIWALMDPSRRRSKQAKDITDIARLLEAYPHLVERIPADMLERLRGARLL